VKRTTSVDSLRAGYGRRDVRNKITEATKIPGHNTTLMMMMMIGKVATEFNQVPSHESVWWSGGIATRILNLGTGWR
jgi:hypothetical protein